MCGDRAKGQERLGGGELNGDREEIGGQKWPRKVRIDTGAIDLRR